MTASKLAQKQAIRLSNTLLAAAGGALLSLILIVSYFNNTLYIDAVWFFALLTVHWLVNAVFIALIATGANLRFARSLAHPASDVLGGYQYRGCPRADCAN